MGRKHKVVNKSGIPQYAIDRFARSVFDDMREDFMKPEVQADFQRWLAEREQNKKKAAATKVAAASSFIWFLWADRYGGRYAHKG